jgi:peptidoglycan hydrolase-like protein with peptidoglycan-binding domain
VEVVEVLAAVRATRSPSRILAGEGLAGGTEVPCRVGAGDDQATPQIGGPVPKNVGSAVGYGGSNLFQNVTTVQYLLNCVPATRGGPVPELVVDGLAGPKTIAAIRKFQTATFGSADGRVDPNGATIHALQGFDPFPEQPLGPAAVVKTPLPPAPFVKWSFAAGKVESSELAASKFGASKSGASKFAPGKPVTGAFGGGKTGPGFGAPGTGGKLGG